MSRRSWAGVLAAVLVLGLSVVALSRPVPYVTFAPGPTVNVLGKSENKEIIEISGRKTYDDNGALRLVTVIPSGPQEKVSLPGLVAGWVSPDIAVYPYRAIYQATDTRQSVRQESSNEMVSSQDSAVAAALAALHIPYKSGVKIASVQKGGPADGKLKTGDFVVSVDGKPVDNVTQLTSAIRPRPVGSDVTVKVRRDQVEHEYTMRTTGSPQDKKKSAVLVSIAPGYRFPFDVHLNLAQNIGGPSAGMMFALGIYDSLTPGSLTNGKVIAGTGEIDAQGRVGEIGGIQQKLVGAQHDGAKLFLVPAANCAEAVKGHYDPDKMRLVKVHNLKDAIADVKAWAKNPDADLPGCAA